MNHFRPAGNGIKSLNVTKIKAVLKDSGRSLSGCIYLFKRLLILLLPLLFLPLHSLMLNQEQLEFPGPTATSGPEGPETEPLAVQLVHDLSKGHLCSKRTPMLEALHYVHLWDQCV